MMRKAKKTPLQLAVQKLFELGLVNHDARATPEQILEVSEEFELWGGPSELEGAYLDMIDRLADM